ncbi:MAG TPA: hypothetical protein DCY79_08230 [Planctomycetaceae bacterium]|nr:hypothetical protein [Blastopirellula sp.]HAY79778.1 hypothetical protein [Planctomycetaceae bacterium]
MDSLLRGKEKRDGLPEESTGRSIFEGGVGSEAQRAVERSVGGETQELNHASTSLPLTESWKETSVLLPMPLPVGATSWTRHQFT